MAKITLIGMYDWDNALFDNLTVPEGIEKDVLIDSILLRGGEFEVIYPDYDFLKYSIGAWSRKYQSTMERWLRALTEEYNPLENYNRIESWTDGESGSESGSSSDSISGSKSGSASGSASGSTSGSTGSTTTNKVSAYDAGDTLTTRDQSELHGTDSSTSSSTTGSTTSETTSETRGGTTSGQYSKSATRSGTVHGNIGVMSSQNMLLQELDVGYRNIYNMLTDLFLTEFVLPIY